MVRILWVSPHPFYKWGSWGGKEWLARYRGQQVAGLAANSRLPSTERCMIFIMSHVPLPKSLDGSLPGVETVGLGPLKTRLLPRAHGCQNLTSVKITWELINCAKHKPCCGLDQLFSNFRVHTYLLGILLKCRFRRSGSGVRVRVCIPNKFPSDTDAACPWTTLLKLKGLERVCLCLNPSISTY